MELITIDRLPEAEELTNEDLFPLNQAGVTKSVKLELVNDIIHFNTMIEVRELVETEAETRELGDHETLQASKEYTDQEITKNKLAVNEWLAPVKTVSQIPVTGLDNTRNYLIKVVADAGRSGVYQAVAGWKDVPEWVLYDSTVDFVDGEELEVAIDGHDTDDKAHEDIRAQIAHINENYVNETGVKTIVNAHNQNINSHTDIRNIIKNHIGIPTWDDDNYILTFTAENGGKLEIDIPLESLAKDLDYDPLTKELIITKQDGAEIRVDVADLFDLYEGSTGTHIQITVEDNVIKAALLVNSVTEYELSSALLEKINSKIGADIIGQPDGVAELDAEGRVPMEQLPEILTGDLTALEGRILERLFPIGIGYRQGLNDPDPIDLDLPGTWQLWIARAEAYRLTTAAVPGWVAYTAGANYGAGAYVTYHLAGDDYGIWKAKAAVTNAAAQLDPVLWEKYTTGSIVERRLVQEWLDNDLTLGATVPDTGKS
jgi:hypothetical protein